MSNRAWPFAFVLMAGILLCNAAAHASAAGIGVPRVGGMNPSGPAEGMVTAIYHNPAAMSLLDGTHVFLDVTATYFQSEFDRDGVDPFTGRPYKEVGFSTVTPVPFVGITSDLGLEKLTFGLGAYVPFGRIAHWPERGTQRYQLIDVEIQSYTFSPAVALDLTHDISIGASLNIIYQVVNSKVSVDLAEMFEDLASEMLKYRFPEGSIRREQPEWEGTLESRNGGFNFGWGAGLLLRPAKWLDVGACYQSQVNITARGDFNLELPTRPFNLFGFFEAPNGVVSLLNDLAGLDTPTTIRGDTTFSFRLPQSLTIGFQFRPDEFWAIDLSVNWTDWSVYDKIKVRFKSANSDLDMPPNEVLAEYVDSYYVNLGASWRPTARTRFGVWVMYETDAVPDNTRSVLNVDAEKVDLLVAGSVKITDSFNLGLGFSHIFYMKSTRLKSVV